MIPLVCSGRYAVGDNVLCTPVPASLVTMPTRWHGVGIGRGVFGLGPFGCSGQNAIKSDTGSAGGGGTAGAGAGPGDVDPPGFAVPAGPVVPGALTVPGVRGVPASPTASGAAAF